MSDAHRDEIAKLEALYREHPEGRVFTHLAEAYRKGGELERAKDVLTEGIERHPDYSSAHVVLGRVLLDLGQLEEARGEFRRVLELDQHNLVALRSLGDIARAEGRSDDALARYRELLELEPSDSEVAALVKEITVGPDLTTVGRESWADATADAAPGGEERTREAEPVGDEEEPEEAAPAEGADEEETAVAAGEEDWMAGEDEAEDRAEEAEAESWAATEEASDEAEPWAGAADEDDEAWTTAAEEPEEWSGAGEDEWAAAGSEESEPYEPAGPDVPEGPEQELAGESEDGADVMTETIAQVYARQGLYDRAIEVYRGLLEKRPDDEGLKERLASVEAMAEAERAAETEPAEGAEADVEPAGAGESDVMAAGIETDPTFEDLEPDEDSVLAGFQSTGFEAVDEDAAPLDGLEAHDTDPETGLVTDDVDAEGPVEEAAEPVGAEYEEPVVEADASDEDVWETPWDEPVEAAAVTEPPGAEEEIDTGEADEPEPEPESPWVAEDWSGAEVEPETPYAWADTEETEDGSPPIGDYLAGILEWGARVTPEPAASSAEQDGGTVPATDEDAASEGGDDDDDDLEMFRSWLESLKQ